MPLGLVEQRQLDGRRRIGLEREADPRSRRTSRTSVSARPSIVSIGLAQ